MLTSALTVYPRAIRGYSFRRADLISARLESVVDLQQPVPNMAPTTPTAAADTALNRN